MFVFYQPCVGWQNLLFVSMSALSGLSAGIICVYIACIHSYWVYSKFSVIVYNFSDKPRALNTLFVVKV